MLRGDWRERNADFTAARAASKEKSSAFRTDLLPVHAKHDDEELPSRKKRPSPVRREEEEGEGRGMLAAASASREPRLAATACCIGANK